MSAAPLTYAELVALSERIRDGAGVYVEPTTLDQLQRAHVREERSGVTPGGMPWRSVA